MRSSANRATPHSRCRGLVFHNEITRRTRPSTQYQLAKLPQFVEGADRSFQFANTGEPDAVQSCSLRHGGRLAIECGSGANHGCTLRREVPEFCKVCVGPASACEMRHEITPVDPAILAISACLASAR